MAVSKVLLSANECYEIPDEVMISPLEILDEKNEVYRVCIGRADLTEDEAAQYQPFFNAINRRILLSPFISGIRFIVNGMELDFGLTYVYRAADIYEFEISIADEVIYKGTDTNADKETQSRCISTDKSTSK